MADVAAAEWRAFAEALVPIIGKSAVTILYRRCLASVGVDRTWLPSVSTDDLPDNDWAVLRASMLRQTAMEASETRKSLVAEFRELLGSLIGPSLAEQLLHPVSIPPLTDSADQATLP